MINWGNVFGQSGGIGINNSLPLTIIVLAKVGLSRYMLKVGNKEISTKSNIELDVGKSYWGELSSDKDGVIYISSLVKKPDILQNQYHPVYINADAISNFFENQDMLHEYKAMLLTTLAKSKTRDDFYETANLLNSLNDGVVSLIINQNGNYQLLQYRYGVDNIEFFATLESYGKLFGKIIFNELENIFLLYLECEYKSVCEFLLNKSSDILGIDLVDIKHNVKIRQFYEFKESNFEVKI